MQLSPKLQSHKDNCILTFREDFQSINKCFLQSSVTQMRVTILPPSVDCSGSAVTQAKSPPSHPVCALHSLFHCLRAFHPFFPKCVFLLWLFFLSYTKCKPSNIEEDDNCQTYSAQFNENADEIIFLVPDLHCCQLWSFSHSLSSLSDVLSWLREALWAQNHTQTPSILVFQSTLLLQ